MITPATTTAFTLNPLTVVVHSTTSYDLAFTFAVPHSIGDYFLFSIDPSMIFSSLTCVAVSGASLSGCVTPNSTTIKVTFAAGPSSSAQIRLSYIRNYDISNTAISFTVSFFNSLDYPMETTPTRSLTYTADTIVTFSVNNNDQIALYEYSNITLTVSSPFGIDSSFNSSSTQLVITPPGDFTVDNTTTCAATSGTCTNSGSTFIVQPVGRSLTGFTVLIRNIQLPFFVVASSSFIIQFQYQSKDIASVSSGVTVQPYCTSPCQRCISNRTACASCLPSPNSAIYLFTSNSSCLGSCPATYYPDTGNICQSCISPCSECLDSENCTKCITGRWLYVQ